MELTRLVIFAKDSAENATLRDTPPLKSSGPKELLMPFSQKEPLIWDLFLTMTRVSTPVPLLTLLDLSLTHSDSMLMDLVLLILLLKILETHKKLLDRPLSNSNARSKDLLAPVSEIKD